MRLPVLQGHSGPPLTATMLCDLGRRSHHGSARTTPRSCFGQEVAPSERPPVACNGATETSPPRMAGLLGGTRWYGTQSGVQEATDPGASTPDVRSRVGAQLSSGRAGTVVSLRAFRRRRIASLRPQWTSPGVTFVRDSSGCGRPAQSTWCAVGACCWRQVVVAHTRVPSQRAMASVCCLAPMGP
jgi:hypothetical protein